MSFQAHFLNGLLPTSLTGRVILSQQQQPIEKRGLKNSGCMGFFFMLWTTKRRKTIEPPKYREGVLPSVLVLPLLEQSSKMKPANATPKSDRHAFQLLTTQSVLSVPKKAWDSCWRLHSAFSVMMAHSPRPSPTQRKRNMVRPVVLADSYKDIQAPAFQAVCLAMCSLNFGDILHICNIFINNNSQKINKRGLWIFWKRRRQCNVYSERQRCWIF